MNQEGESESVDDISTQESIGLSDEESNKVNNTLDNDIRNAELVFDAHNADPFEVMRIMTYDDAPMAKGKVC